MDPLVHPEEDLSALLVMGPLVLVEDHSAGVAVAMLAVVVQQVPSNRQILGVAMSGLRWAKNLERLASNLENRWVIGALNLESVPILGVWM
ncbi:hypothetical protein PtrM4_114160 [Pyrenophora tritici-repentis]|uniref:Uncharacterized protein n=1 Tax=Pyrenophora tritici-repentis TaxID=45151 RepID=A0A834VLM2_9PLEO|nr:hypothetical protein A1F99_081750 [Pyrenophora tritici-repentis]KAF7569001.1 hypothetical protein PtrM4_114160 [Pyrenophora tritici-repentis]